MSARLLLCIGVAACGSENVTPPPAPVEELPLHLGHLVPDALARRETCPSGWKIEQQEHGTTHRCRGGNDDLWIYVYRSGWIEAILIRGVDEADVTRQLGQIAPLFMPEVVDQLEHSIHRDVPEQRGPVWSGGKLALRDDVVRTVDVFTTAGRTTYLVQWSTGKVRTDPWPVPARATGLVNGR
jgi:hypothetical protein